VRRAIPFWWKGEDKVLRMHGVLFTSSCYYGVPLALAWNVRESNNSSIFWHDNNWSWHWLGAVLVGTWEGTVRENWPEFEKWIQYRVVTVWFSTFHHEHVVLSV
jgi:hypothetical protein